MTPSEEMAKAMARLALQPLLMRPAGERIAAVTMMLQLVIMTDVKEARRLEFFNDLVDKMRADIFNDTIDELRKKGEVDAEDGDQRGHRSKAARKKGRR